LGAGFLIIRLGQQKA